VTAKVVGVPEPQFVVRHQHLLNAPLPGAAGQPLEQNSTVLLLNGSLRLHNTSSSSSGSGTSGAGSGASAAASKATSSPSKRGLFRGRSQRTAPPSAGSSAAAAAAEQQGGVSAAAGAGQGQYGSMRQYSAPALLAWGPQLFDTMEDRWGGGFLGWT